MRAFSSLSSVSLASAGLIALASLVGCDDSGDADATEDAQPTAESEDPADDSESPSETEEPAPEGEAESADPEAGPTAAFFGERECEFTTATFAGEWSPPDTSTETFYVTEVEGGFAVAGEPNITPFGSCEVVFDLDGTEATLRDPQPCTGGIATYDSGKAVVTGDDFSFDILGQALGYTVSMVVDCGAGVAPEDEETEQTGWVGDWTCDGVLGGPIGGPDGLPIAFTHTVSEDRSGSLRSTFTADGEVAVFVMTFNSCDMQWEQTSDATAELLADSVCATGPNSFVQSDGGLTLEDSMLFGDVYVEDSGQVQQELTFDCTR